MRGLPRMVKLSLEKALDSALLAVEVYNKPAVKFKSGGFITLMVIAWTSLFHAYFFKNRLKPYKKLTNGRFDKRDGDYVYWELSECLKQYYKSDSSNPTRKNIEFFIPLRNKIEHKSLPAIDSDIFGECQSFLLNFDKFVEMQFGAKYCLRESLSFSLQLFPSLKKINIEKNKDSETRAVQEFIRQYRTSISSNTMNSGEYSFKAFLIQVANHEKTSTLPIQFINYNDLTFEEQQELSRFVTLIQTKQVPVANPEGKKPGDVVKSVQMGLGDPKIRRGEKDVDKFNLSIHTNCWIFYKVRPNKETNQPEATRIEFCIYDATHKDYVYTQAWIDFLIKMMSDDNEYQKVAHRLKPNIDFALNLEASSAADKTGVRPNFQV